jgi:tetratricopeptide (TPR) repeat protein
MDIDKSVESAMKYFQQGDISRAEEICEELLTLHPNNPLLLHMIGSIYYQVNKHKPAKDHLEKALLLDPGNADINYDLGNLFHEMGMIDDAIFHFSKALQLKPLTDYFHNNLGVAYMDKGNLSEALTQFQKAIEINPYSAEAYNNVGLVFQNEHEVDRAIAYFRKAIQYDSHSVKAYNNLGNAFKGKGLIDDALFCYQKALELSSDCSDAYFNIANILDEKEEIDSAILYYEKALGFQNNDPDIHNNLGFAYFKKGDFFNAMNFYKEALRLDCNFAEAHWNHALFLLLTGNFIEGWEEYEWRSRTKNAISDLREFQQPRWNGSHSPNSTMFLHAEQGFGDTIQFIRYISLVAPRCKEVIVECQKDLIPLIRAVKGVHKVIAHGDQMPDFDIHCPLLTLPFIFQTTLDSIPGDVPYLIADPSLTQKWKEELGKAKGRLRIGIAWAGNPSHLNDRNRSCRIEDLIPLLQTGGVTYFSLQKNMTIEQDKHLQKETNIIELTENIKDFSDTAAIIENLDLVISVDTSVAHLAGALGKPVWTLLPFVPDWRWMLNREDSPWYPTMRLFRQTSRGDWISVVERVRKEICLLVGNIHS